MSVLPPVDWYRDHTFWQIGLAAAGGTFMDWSINYLLGIDQHTVIYDHTHEIAVVPKNPLQSGKTTAHAHIKNHPKDAGEMILQSWTLHRWEPNSTHTFYCYNHTLNLDDSKYLMANFESSKNFFQTIMGSPQAIVHGDFDTASMFLHYRYLTARQGCHDLVKVSNHDPVLAEQLQDIVQPWAKREMTALYFWQCSLVRQKLLDRQQYLTDQLSPHAVCVPLSYAFERLDSVLLEIKQRFNNLNWKEEKFASWHEIYRTWKKHNAQIDWFKKMPLWIDAIVNGKRLFLPAMDDIAQCCLEAELMKSNWSIKNEGLVHLPRWTDEIGLEPLRHPKIHLPINQSDLF